MSEEEKGTITYLDNGETKKTCVKCGRQKSVKDFFTYQDGRKMELCKECLTMHIDNFKPETFLWILEKMDVPYIEEQWITRRDREYARNPKKFNGASVIGKYISGMKLGQYKKLRWADGERLREEKEHAKEKAAQEFAEYTDSIKEKYAAGEISEAEYRTLIDTQTQYTEDLKKRMSEDTDAVGENNFYREDNFIDEKNLPDPTRQLTDDDKVYLAMKWGRLYKPSEWIEMETKYNDMLNSFDIQDSDTKSSLILICKTLLKMNQAIDEGDVESYQKLSRVYESMRKSAKFTAVQNKEERGNDIDCIGEFVLLCEKEKGFIPRFLTNAPQDKVDLTLKNMNEYTNNLIINDLGIGDQIEQQLKKMEMQREADRQEEEENGGPDRVLTDEEIAQYYQDIQDEREEDANFIESESADFEVTDSSSLEGGDTDGTI